MDQILHENIIIYAHTTCVLSTRKKTKKKKPVVLLYYYDIKNAVQVNSTHTIRSLAGSMADAQHHLWQMRLSADNYLNMCINFSELVLYGAAKNGYNFICIHFTEIHFTVFFYFHYIDATKANGDENERLPLSYENDFVFCRSFVVSETRCSENVIKNRMKKSNVYLN